MKFIRNTWYVAAWGDEVGRALLPRTLLEEPVVLYRRTDGRPVAMQDRCPHRFAPLHMGQLDGDVVECPYHGLRFDGTGACVLNPHGEGRIPGAARVGTYAVEERYGVVWIWMGRSEDADASKIPSFGHLVDPSLRTVKGSTHIKANYQLVADNLLDLTHTQFLHARTQKTPDFLVVPHEVVQEGSTVHSRRWMANTRGAKSFMRNFPDPEMPVDQWTRARWDPPGLCRLDTGVTPTGRPETEGIRRNGSHLLTPETETSTHYFFANTRNYRQDDAAADADIREWQRVGFEEEDKPMLEAVQARMGTTDLMALKPILLSPDGAAMRARRIMQRLAAQEAGTDAQLAA